MWGIVVRLFGGMLLSIAGSLAGRVLLSLGFSFVTYEGFNVGIDWLRSQIISNFAGMPADVVSFLAWLWVDKAISLIFSAYSAAVLIQMAGGTAITRLVAKK